LDETAAKRSSPPGFRTTSLDDIRPRGFEEVPPSFGLAGDNQKLFTEEAPQKRPPQIDAKKEQRRRFLERIDTPHKNWKFSLDDVQEREYWRQYMKAYEACLGATSRKSAPWYVVPADDKKNARIIVSQVLIDTLDGLKLRYPRVSAERRRELRTIRRKLTS
jgi:hypothetical protein